MKTQRMTNAIKKLKEVRSTWKILKTYAAQNAEFTPELDYLIDNPCA